MYFNILLSVSQEAQLVDDRGNSRGVVTTTNRLQPTWTLSER